MFSWRRVDSFQYHRLTGGRIIPSGQYASDAVNQHAASWCGCCYLIASAQMVEDRARIALSKTAELCAARPRLSLQIVMDHYVEREAGPAWSACHGGVPLHVLQCMRDGTCPLVWTMERPPRTWLGFPRTRRAKERVEHPLVRVKVVGRISPSTVRDELLKYGPVVLEVSAQTLKSADPRGLVVDLTPRKPDHAVCVVGWSEVGGEACWIVRNSWGRTRAPVDVPRDMSCARKGSNDCVVQWEPWSGDPSDPGFCHLPQRFEPLSSCSPSPWLAARVERDVTCAHRLPKQATHDDPSPA